MDRILFTAVMTLVPFIGTALGALAVFCIGREPRESVKKFLLGFASGVMLAASVWSLILPSIELASQQGRDPDWLPAILGFAFGMLILGGADMAITRFCEKDGAVQGRGAKGCARLFTAVTLHNIPEGMAVGVALSAAISESTAVGYASAAALTFGIAVQNFPEGAVVSMPFAASGMSRVRAFAFALLSGIVEPVFCVITVFAVRLIYPALPCFLSFAAGAMVYVVAEELLPEAHEGRKSMAATLGVTLGFCLMMLLDICLG